jgi:hypothetical protein
MVNVPDCELALGFAATEYVTVPLPLPLLPERIVIQPAELVADQLQPAEVLTPTELVPPLELKPALLAERE